MAKSKFHLTPSGMVREAGTLISGNVLAQGINLVAYLLLTRLFSPADYGIYNIFYSYIEVLTILSTCKYELAIVVADSDSEAGAIRQLSLRLNAIFSLLLLLIITVLCTTHALPGDAQTLGYIALLIPPMVFLCGTTRVYSFFLNRYHRYREIATSEVVTTSAGVVSKIVFGLFQSLHLIGLPLGTVIGKLAGNLSYRLQSRHLPFAQRQPYADLKMVARKHRNFPLFVMPKDFLNSFSSNLPFLWLALYFGKAEIGLFSLALTFTFRPVNILNNAFEKVLYARVSEKVRSHQSIHADIRRFLLVVGFGSLPLFAIGYLYAEPIFTFLFSGKWQGCGYYVRCLLPWVYVMLLSTSLMFISNVFSTQHTEFIFYLVLLLLRIAALVIGISQSNFHLSILLYSLAGTAIALSLLIWYLSQVRRYEARCKEFRQ